MVQQAVFGIGFLENVFLRYDWAKQRVVVHTSRHLVARLPVVHVDLDPLELDLGFESLQITCNEGEHVSVQADEGQVALDEVD